MILDVDEHRQKFFSKGFGVHRLSLKMKTPN